MSWSPDLFIGEFRPWPDTVHVVRGKTDEMRRYVPEEERDMYRDLVDCMVHPDVPDQLYAENVKLRELVRDMWRELAVSCAEQVTSHETLRKVSDRMREFGIEVDG